MKSYRNIVLIIALSIIGCNDSFLNLKPTDKVSADALFASPEGIKVFMANLYSQMPIEDFNSTPMNGISYNDGGPNNAGFFLGSSLMKELIRASGYYRVRRRRL